MNLQQWWSDLDADQQVKYKKLSWIGLFVIIALFAYYTTQAPTDAEKEAKLPTITKTVTSTQGTFEDDVRTEVRSLIDKETEARSTDIDSLANSVERIMDILGEKRNTETQLPPLETLTPGTVPNYPPSPVDATPVTTIQNDYYGLPQTTITGTPGVDIKTATLGGIGRSVGAQQPKKNEAKQSKQRKWYLAPSFMKAQLLEGIEIGVGQNALENPESFLFRVQTPAILPNSMKANLKGCYAVANAIGKLNKERIDLRTVSIHCINNKDRTMIEASIKGHINDIDGKKGLSARVVTKAGSSLGRAFLAGTVSGIGEGFSAGTNRNTISSTGAVVSDPLSSSQITQVGLGEGVSRGAQHLEDYYLEILKQTTPTLESGSAREVTIVLTEGTWLEVKSLDNVSEKTASTK